MRVDRSCCGGRALLLRTTSRAVADGPIVRGQHCFAGSNSPNGYRHRLRQFLGRTICTHSTLAQPQQSSGFRGAQIKFRLECGQVGSAHRALLVAHQPERIGAVIQPVIPFDAAAEIRRVNPAKCARVIEKNPEMSGPMYQASQINARCRAILPKSH